MSANARAKLAAQQAKLMQCLTEDTSLAGFDADRLHVTAVSLLQKRIRTVERIHPCLVSTLGTSFSHLFIEYARTHQIPTNGPVDFLAKTEKLPQSMWKAYFFSTGWRNPRTWWYCIKFSRSVSRQPQNILEAR
jgi:hypothetical protein